jgi:hypothetical protein
VFIKAADGPAFDARFTPELIRELRANGISVCAWTFDYGASPLLEAEAAIAAVRTGARCLVVDAEGQYDTRYRAAQLFVHILRRHLGRAFPIGLAGQAETTQHPTFPYSVFLAPGAFQFDLPQIYWRDLRLTVPAAYATTIPENTIYGRPILPVGQLYGEPSPGEVAEFAKVAANYGLTGVSFFSLEAAQPPLLDALAVRPRLAHRRTKFATLSAGADGDQVLWAQELLDGAGARLPAGGFFGSQTARAVARFQHQHHLTPTGALDPATWTALLRVRPRTPSWAKRPPLSAR